MPKQAVRRRWLAAAGLLAGAICPPPTAAQTGAAPTLAQVRQAYAQAHPLRRPDCDPANLFFSLEVPQNVAACQSNDTELTFYYRGHATTLDQQQYGHDFYHFNLLQNGREVGNLLADIRDCDEPVVLYLNLTTPLRATLGNLPDTGLWAVGSPCFAREVRQVLAQGPLLPAPTYFTAPVLNDKGYALQQLGCQPEALLFFNEVLRRYPTRAVAYLNRGDTQWALNQVPAAQADYRRYLALLRTQGKDTTRVPTYVRLALRLPNPQ